MNHSDLQNRWHRLTTAFQVAQSLAQEDFIGLLNAHSQPARHYHNVNHLRSVLETLDELCDLALRPECIELALWYHDAVYDSRAKDNEERSADWLMDVSRKWNLNEEIAQESHRLILLTQSHETSEVDVDGQILLDADLAILGADSETYQEYAHAIRQEYAWVSDSDYRQGRADVLSRFLSRGRLFFTEIMRDRFEQRARDNLHNELQMLSGSGPEGREVRGEGG